MTQNTNITIARTKQDFAFCAALRALVYVHEQSCPIIEEYDDLEDECTHYIMTRNGHPIATARYRVLDDDTAKIERIVVLKDQRGNGFGKDIVTHLEKEIKSLPKIRKIVMSAQDYALPFYEKLGYEVIGEGYIEANIPHHKIEKHMR